MKIGINALYLRPGKNGGIEIYFRELLRSLTAIDGANVYYVYLSREAAEYPLPQSRAIERRVMPVSASRQVSRYLLEQLLLPYYVLIDSVDILHSLAYVCPIFLPCASIVTAHDLNYRAFGSLMRPLQRLGLSLLCPLSYASSDRVIAVSEFTRRLLVEELAVSYGKVTTIHESGAPLIRSHNPPNANRVKKRYILAFGGRFPNKNIGRLLQAYDRISAEIEHDLVIIGDVAPCFERNFSALSEVSRPRVHRLGYLSDTEVGDLMQYASLYVHPSIYEGFGMPILEAQARGVLVVSSSAASLPEIAGAGAIYFDPYSVDSMAAAIQKAVVDSLYRSQIIAGGHLNLARFSWHKAATQTLEMYFKVTNSIAI